MIGPVGDFSNLVSLRAAQQNRLKLNQAMHRLSTSQRINRASDDPAGLIASVNMDATLAALEAETDANQRAIHMADTADTAIGQISDLLTEAKTLATANANDAGLSDAEKQANQLEIDAILSSVDRIARTTSFNGHKLLDGSGEIRASGKKLAIASSRTSEIGSVEIDGDDYVLSDIGKWKPLDTTSSSNGESAAKVIDAAISQVSTIRGKVGAFSRNTLETRVHQIANSRQHMLATVSIIRDADYGVESSANVRAEMLHRGSMILLKRSRTGGILSVYA